MDEPNKRKRRMIFGTATRVNWRAVIVVAGCVAVFGVLWARREFAEPPPIKMTSEDYNRQRERREQVFAQRRRQEEAQERERAARSTPVYSAPVSLPPPMPPTHEQPTYQPANDPQAAVQQTIGNINLARQQFDMALQEARLNRSGGHGCSANWQEAQAHIQEMESIAASLPPEYQQRAALVVKRAKVDLINDVQAAKRGF